MSPTNVPIHRQAPAPDGPIACTLSPNDYAGRLDDFRHGVFTHLVDDLEVPAEAAPTLDAMAMLAELGRPRGDASTRAGR
jgi:hypothetical protein